MRVASARVGTVPRYHGGAGRNRLYKTRCAWLRRNPDADPCAGRGLPGLLKLSASAQRESGVPRDRPVARCTSDTLISAILIVVQRLRLACARASGRTAQGERLPRIPDGAWPLDSLERHMECKNPPAFKGSA